MKLLRLLGPILALLSAGYMLAFDKLAPVSAYLGATGFLFHWYLVWTIVLGFFVLIFALFLSIGGVVAGAGSGGKLGALLGTILGGGLSSLIVIHFLFRRAAFVLGAYLLHIAVTLGPAGAVSWDIATLVCGGFILFVGFLTRPKSSAKSS